MYEAGKAAQVSAEMRRYNIALLGLSETRWLQAGQKRLASGELLLYSGHEEENAAHTEGVAIMLSRTARKALIGWEAHGNTWRRDLEADAKQTGCTWRELERIAQDRGRWRTVVDGLCPSRGSRPK